MMGMTLGDILFGLGLCVLLAALSLANRKPKPVPGCPCEECTPEAPMVPQDFRPAKPLPKRSTRPVSDRLVRQVRAHARETHGLDQEGPRA